MLALVDLMVDDLVRVYLTPKPAPDNAESPACANPVQLPKVDQAA
jgi:hypothetical protein